MRFASDEAAFAFWPQRAIAQSCSGKKEVQEVRKKKKKNVKKGLLTRQYLNNTALSPNEQKEGKGTMT